MRLTVLLGAWMLATAAWAQGGAAEGRVAAYVLTPEAGVAGLLLEDGRQVRVPMHEGAALAALVKPGDRVGLGERDGAVSITALDSGKSLAEVAAPPRPVPPSRADGLRPLAVAGVVKFLLRNPRGEVDGAVLDTGVQIALPPPAAREAGDRLATGRSLHVQGYGRRSTFGTVVQVTSLAGDDGVVLDVYGERRRP